MYNHFSPIAYARTTSMLYVCMSVYTYILMHNNDNIHAYIHTQTCITIDVHIRTCIIMHILHIHTVHMIIYRITRNFRSSMASYYFVLKHSRLLMMDLRIMPVMELIRHKMFAVVYKTAKSVKDSCHESFKVAIR